MYTTYIALPIQKQLHSHIAVQVTQAERENTALFPPKLSDSVELPLPTISPDEDAGINREQLEANIEEDGSRNACCCVYFRLALIVERVLL